MAISQKKSWVFAAIPVLFFAAIAAIFFVMLTSPRDPSAVPSVLVGKQVPQIKLGALEGGKSDGLGLPGFDTADLLDSTTHKGRVIIVNVWASWCGPCRQEHPFLMELGQRDDLMLVGINYKDKTTQALGFLAELGNPFERIGVDPNGRAAIELGVYGVPETYILSFKGVVIYKHVGPIISQHDRDIFNKKIIEAAK